VPNQHFREFIESFNALEHHRKNKLASGRRQDLADLENLE